MAFVCKIFELMTSNRIKLVSQIIRKILDLAIKMIMCYEVILNEPIVIYLSRIIAKSDGTSICIK